MNSGAILCGLLWSVNTFPPLMVFPNYRCEFAARLPGNAATVGRRPRAEESLGAWLTTDFTQQRLQISPAMCQP